MTTPRFRAISSAVARTMSAVRAQHCQPPTFRPAAPVRDSMRGMACGGLLQYTASAIDGRTSGRCSSAGCIRWTE
jgi:hypothetical protein